MKNNFLLILCVAMLMSVVGCSTKEEAKVTTQEAEPVAEETAKGTEPEEAKVETTDSEKPFNLGLANINERGAFGKLVKYGFEEAAKKRGWTLSYVDNNSDGQTAVSNAQLLVNKDVDFVVDMNVDASVGQTIMDIFNKAEIPVMAVDIQLPGAPFFGINNKELGYINGVYAADYIKENWDGQVDYVVLITQIASGEEVQKRVRSSVDALKDSGIEIGEVVEIEGENDAGIAQKRFNDFLTSHPETEKVAVFTINENTAQGAHAAATTANREWDTRIFSANCGTQFVEPMYVTQGNQSWVSTVANFPEFYGDQVCAIIESYIAGGTLEEEYPANLVVIDWENIKEYYPEDNLPWEKF